MQPDPLDSSAKTDVDIVMEGDDLGWEDRTCHEPILPAERDDDDSESESDSDDSEIGEDDDAQASDSDLGPDDGEGDEHDDEHGSW
jgi:hypothetical protein